MAKASRFKSDKTQVNLNLTAMMDVVFQLIVFFLLVTNFTSAELPKLEVPNLEESQAIVMPDRRKVVVNVIPEDGGTGLTKGLKVGITEIPAGEYGLLTDMLRKEIQNNPAVEIDLRADATIHYEQVQPVMNAITNAEITRVNLVADLNPDKR